MSFVTSLFGSPVPTLSASELNEKLKNGKRPYVLDVRQPEEFRSGHIISAKMIPLGELSGRIKELPADREIVCVCESGSRSVAATRKLLAAGFNATNMEGGMIAWQRARLPIKKGATS
jgi:rhodanese-related sulfurtransferase